MVCSCEANKGNNIAAAALVTNQKAAAAQKPAVGSFPFSTTQ
jgi:hypothetical protein